MVELWCYFFGVSILMSLLRRVFEVFDVVVLRIIVLLDLILRFIMVSMLWRLMVVLLEVCSVIGVLWDWVRWMSLVIGWVCILLCVLMMMWWVGMVRSVC